MSERAVDELGYAEALAELEAILRELESAAVDVDRLTDRVVRAKALVARCRERVSDARVHVEQAVAEPPVHEPPPDTSPPDGPRGVGGR